MELKEGLTVYYEATRDDIDFITNGIIEYNKSVAPVTKFPPYERFSIIIKDNNHHIVAGILTRIFLKCVYVEILWVNDELRKYGIGSKLLNEAEKITKEKGCKMIHLDTLSFQAPDFYKKHGYSIFAVLDDYPDNIKRYYMKKNL